jgi:hypothetical protein
MSTSPPIHHPALAAGRWLTLPLIEQLGNVGSEVERALRAHAQGQSDRFDRALDRALELFDLTANDPRWRGHRCREVLRAREQFCRVFFDETVEPGLSDYLRKYFLQFAVAARSARSRRVSPS